MIELPTLYALRQNKKIKQWTVHTEADVVVMAYGVIGGKQAQTRTRAIPTNRGRSNARDGSAQAVFEARAAWGKKKDEGYFETIEKAQSTIIHLPMLAQNAFVERKRKSGMIKEMRVIEFPLDGQRKLNGLRGLATRNKIISRGGEEWHIPHIQEELKQFLTADDQFLDGEVYIHGVPLQTLNSLIKDYREESKALQFHAYDMPHDSGVPWEDRKESLKAHYFDYLDSARFIMPAIHLVETVELGSLQEVEVFEKIAVEKEGYEGLILRQRDRPYKFNTRCDSLLKWKRFQDMEFKIVDVKSRELIKGKESLWICDKFVCQNNTNDRTFEVVPRGTEAERAEFLANKEYYIGKFGCVRFLERSVDGIPQGNPVLSGFRLDEDTAKPETNEEDWGS